MAAPPDRDLARTNLLCVTYHDSVADRLSAWRTGFPSQPRRGRIVSVGEVARSTAATSGGGSSSPPIEEQFGAECVEDPTDLGEICARIDSHLSEWSEDDAHTLLQFDSVDAVLDATDVERTFRLLHVLTNRVRAVGAEGQFYVATDRVDEETRRTIGSLFDEVRTN